MRRRTLIAICFLIVIAFAFGLRAVGFAVPILSPLTIGIFAVPALMLLLTRWNKHLLTWRKAHGRDIENEERYEDEATGMISLRPKQ